MKIFNFDTITSTQDEALKKDFECVIIAKNQTKGRGRFNRKWQSLEGNLLASIVLRAQMQDIFKLVMSISVSVVESIGCGQIKWPNDILINDKKICGILIEKGQDGFYVIGFGINIKHTPDIFGLIYPASSLSNEGINTDSKTVLDSLIINLQKNYQDPNLFEKYQKLLYGKGKLCQINDIKGTLIDVDPSGCLLIKTTTNEIKKIYAGDLFF